MINQTSSVNFTGRCPAIRKGQWASHCVNANLPCVSNVKFAPLIDHLCDRTYIKDPNSPKRYPDFVLKILGKRFGWQDRVNNAYENYLVLDNQSNYTKAILPIKQLAETHLANCHEMARATASILKMNGVENAVVVPLKFPNPSVNHTVCVFNRDGSKFENVINNKTIIVDAWSGIVDFYNNAINKYKTIFNDFFKIDDSKITVKHIEENPLSAEDIKLLKAQFSQFIQKKRPD